MDNSITDWIQAISGFAGFILSALTLVYVVKTLRLQNDVNLQQFELLKIESNRAAREVRPVMTVEYKGRPSMQTGELICTLTCSQNTAHEVCIELLKVHAVPRLSESLYPGYPARTFLVNQTEELVAFLIGLSVAEIICRVHFKDVDGKPYYSDYLLSDNHVISVAGIAGSPHPAMNILAPTVRLSMDAPPYGCETDDAIYARYYKISYATSRESWNAYQKARNQSSSNT